MSNVLVFLPSKRRRRPNSDLSGALASLAAQVTQIGDTQMKTKQEMQQALLLLELLNARARRLIGRIGDDAGRTRLLTQSARIGELVEIARRCVAAL